MFSQKPYPFLENSTTGIAIASTGPCLNSVPFTIRHILLNFQFVRDAMLEIDVLSQMYKLQICIKMLFHAGFG